ncbi:protein FAF1 [Rhypophila sp. PSN 637]
MLGKRKARPTEEKQQEEEDSAAVAARELLRKHFEARFKPVAAPASASCAAKPKNNKNNADSDSKDSDDYYDDEDEDDDMLSDESEEDDEWGGLSEDETPEVEVVDHTSSQPVNISTMSKKELKAYLSSRPPSHTADSAAQTKEAKSKSANPTEEDSAAFLANDLALQRLIAESHILAAAGGNSSHYLSSHAEENAIANNKTFVEGRTRRKTTDLRIQALGAKQSVLSQAKMPMGMRKGINQAVITKEEKRRREARENGVILERPTALKKKGGGVKKRRSERPVDMPGVGKMRGSELRISARDVRSIEGFKPSGGREKKSRGRRR